MPFSAAFSPSRKRQHPGSHYNTSRYQLKRQNLSESSAYWDNLSKIWLTKEALKELDRRNSRPRPTQNHHNQRYLTELNKGCEPVQFAPDFLHDCAPSCLKQIKRISRLGGPDLSDLRNYPKPQNFCDQPMNSNKSSSRSRKRRAESPPSQTGDTKGTTKSTSTTAYSRNFQQHLIDHGVYPPEYRYPDRRKPSKPSNWTEINERLAQPRASLSPSKFSEDHFEDFREVDAYASKEKPITTSVIPILDGDVGDAKCVGGDYLFGNLAPLTDGTLARAKPDHFYGARPEQLDRQIRNKLSDHIIPSMQDDLPMVPNFFLEAKGPDGSLAVATRQACYDGALGARGMHALQSYQQDRSTYDNSAYTLSSTYHGGTLKLYTTHLTEPEGPGRRPEYIMTQLKGWSLTSDLGTFRQGACAYRNGRDWAKEKRDEFIRTANETNSKAQSLLLHSTSHSQTASEAAPTMDDSDVSTLSDDAEHSNAQWSFAATTEGEEEILSRNAKKPRVSSIGQAAGNKTT
ncbi:hypothetical protein, variant 2 [Blastomyces dermatitidis ATCC 26199]|nr:hypothetical protein BDFG_09206 [Blastomyces dermatitidis ATCC 26199]EQL28002.1 hypothetical protein, variant 1 [Blastomyces dermatitidis ATCC 26199]EQL28003.1 hypothetical protein, variant 2 [Blastomyces dermatitidis ATCC 26199]